MTGINPVVTLDKAVKAHQLNNYKQAEKHYLKALKQFPDNQDLHRFMGTLYGDIGKAYLSDKHFTIAKKLGPDSYVLNMSMANSYFKLGLFERACTGFRLSISLSDENKDALFGLANALKGLNNYSESEAIYLKLISSHPDFSSAYLNLANQYIEMSQYHKSLDLLDTSLNEFPCNLDLLKSRAVASKESGDIESAVKGFKKIIELDQKNYDAYNYLGVIFSDHGYLLEARQMLDKAISISSKQAHSYYNNSLNYIRLMELENAKDCLNTALKLNPDYIDAKYALGTIELLNTNYKKGFKYLDERMQVLYGTEIPWCRKLLSNKRTLIRSMKKLGVGDVVMYSSLLSSLKEIQSSICVEVDGRLVKLMERSFPGIDFISEGTISEKDLQSQFDQQTSIASLPKLLNFAPECHTPPVSYLVGNDAVFSVVKKYYQEKFSDNKLIGLAWHSTGTQGLFRSISPEEMMHALELLNAQFISLQHGEPRALAASIESIFIDDKVDPLKDIDKCCEQIKSMDLVITIDNTTAHLAGALGVKTILLLPLSPEWRWGITSSKSYWYQSVSIIRQEQPNSWDEPLRQAFELAHQIL